MRSLQKSCYAMNAIVSLLLATTGCRPNLSVPSTNSVATLREYAHSMSEQAASGDRAGVAEYRAAAAEAYSRACGLGDEDSCRQTVRYWASVSDRSSHAAPVIDSRTGREVEDPQIASLALRAPDEMRRAWIALTTLSVRRAAEQSHATHDVTPLLQLHREFAGSDIDEPAFYAFAMSEANAEPSRKYMEIYLSSGVTGSNDHGASVRRHLAEIELREVVRSLRASPLLWHPLQSFAVRYPDLYIEESAAFEIARASSDVDLMVWYRHRYASVPGMGARVAIVRERHAAVVLPRMVDAMCGQPADAQRSQALRDVAGDFRETASWQPAATRALTCARADGVDPNLLKVVAGIFQGTPAGRQAGEAYDTLQAEAALRSRDPVAMRDYLRSEAPLDSTDVTTANVARVSTALVTALQRSHGMSAEDLEGYRSEFDEDDPEYRQIEALRAAAERRETAAAEREERRQRAEEAREEARERRRECSECVRLQQQVYGGSSDEYRSTVCGQACGVSPERACSNCVRVCVSEGIASPAECRSMACMGACN